MKPVPGLCLAITALFVAACGSNDGAAKCAAESTFAQVQEQVFEVRGCTRSSCHGDSPQSGLDGLIPVEETEAEEGSDLTGLFPNGAKLKARVIRVDQRGRIRLSIRALSAAKPGAARGGPEGEEARNSRLGVMAAAFRRARDN